MRNPIDFMNAKQLHDENFKHNFTTTRVLIDFLKHNLPKDTEKSRCRKSKDGVKRIIIFDDQR